MRWAQTESILKGIFLGLLLFIALQAPDWQALGLAMAVMSGGLVAALACAAFGKLREGYRVQGRLIPFLLFLVLESPELVYAGIVLGTVIAAFLIRRPADDWVLTSLFVGGAILGIVFWFFRSVRQ